jgi:deoxyribodipyrimidine photolyase
MLRTIADLIESVPKSIGERTRPLGEEALNQSGEYILYWMQTAVRVEENPAWNCAVYAGNELRLPVFIYYGLSEKYPYASDRHHTFILQGVRDVQAALLGSGIAFACDLERPGHRGPHLRALASRAALVIIEDMPVEPLSHWTRTRRRNTKTPIVAVDTSCVVPMRLVGKAYDRAFAFRQERPSNFMRNG